jgi:hypothetical protein
MPKTTRSRTRTVVPAVGRGDRDSRATLLAELGPVVYAIVTFDGLVKIGYSSNMAQRYGSYARIGQLVAWEANGTLEREAEIHASLEPYVAKGREWYHPTPEVLAVVYAMREALGITRPIEANLPVT